MIERGNDPKDWAQAGEPEILVILNWNQEPRSSGVMESERLWVDYCESTVLMCLYTKKDR